MTTESGGLAVALLQRRATPEDAAGWSKEQRLVFIAWRRMLPREKLEILARVGESGDVTLADIVGEQIDGEALE